MCYVMFYHCIILDPESVIKHLFIFILYTVILKNIHFCITSASDCNLCNIDYYYYFIIIIITLSIYIAH